MAGMKIGVKTKHLIRIKRYKKELISSTNNSNQKVKIDKKVA